MLLKDGMGLKMENFNIIYVDSLENPFFGGGEVVVTKKQYMEENCIKRGAWTVCRFKGGGLAKKRAMHFM